MHKQARNKISKIASEGSFPLFFLGLVHLAEGGIALHRDKCNIDRREAQHRWINFRRNAGLPNKRPGVGSGENIFPPSMREPVGDGKPQKKRKEEGKNEEIGNACTGERGKRQSSYIFRRININCVINKNERSQEKERERKEREGKSRFLRDWHWRKDKRHEI